MKKLFFVVALATSMSLGLILRSEHPVQSAASETASKPRRNPSYAQLPLRFEANQGQTDGPVKFLARGPGYSLFLTAQGAVLRLRNENCETPETCQPVESVLRMKLVGAQTPTHIAGRDELMSKSNYFVSHDPKQWRANVPNYAKIEYKDIYPGIDVVYYGQQQQLEYDFVIAPKANPKMQTSSFIYYRKTFNLRLTSSQRRRKRTSGQ